MFNSIERSYELPKEENKLAGEDESKGEYICSRCNGWGFINLKVKDLSEFRSVPIMKCPKCKGRGILDWIQKATN